MLGEQLVMQAWQVTCMALCCVVRFWCEKRGGPPC